MLLLLLEQRLVHAAERTDKIIRQILEGHTGSQIVIGIAHSLIIDPSANCTNPCLLLPNNNYYITIFFCVWLVLSEKISIDFFYGGIPSA